ncbi:MAG: cytochrome c oxidase subunit 3 [Acidimicrobiia bacterium]|nr:cytochrome c oxidase subunit 3 [Acidimicrobiia bacterium]
MADDTAVELPPAPPLRRPRTLEVGTALGLAGVAMYFAAIMGIYALVRHDTLARGETWFAPGTVQVAPGVMMWFTTLLSVVTMYWAVYALARDVKLQAYTALLLTVVFGAAILNQTVFYLNDIGLGVADSVASTMLYVVVGSHMALVLFAIAAVVLTSIRALLGQYTSQRVDGVVAASYVWYLMVAVYSAVWILVYVTK